MTFSTPNHAQTTTLNYLALGDSYTIGEGVDLGDRYPMQLVREWNENAKTQFATPLIIAKTGCKDVSFEAIIKEGKASLKATPIR